MKSATVCIACSGSVSMELLFHRKPTVIVYKVKRWAMLAQAIVFRAKFITLVNLIATADIRKKTWKPFDPDENGAEPFVMPEYLTAGDPSTKVARHVIRWMSDDELRECKVSEMDALALKYAIPGASDRAADYILQQLKLENGKLDPSHQTVPDNSLGHPNNVSAA